MKTKKFLPYAIIAMFAIAGTIALALTLADSSEFGFNPSSGSLIVNDSTASGGKAIQFGESTSNTGGSGNGQLPANAAANIALIRNNSETANDNFDDNPFKDVPMDQIKLSDLTVIGDPYGDNRLPDTEKKSGLFRVKCEVSHFAYDDPIVYPGQPGRAHLHMFFGNTKANAYSTYDSLLNTGTGTCNGEDLNRTAYWVPAVLSKDGSPLPWEVMVYYKNTNFKHQGRNDLVEPYPENLRMISGDASASSPQTVGTNQNGGGAAQVSFSCGTAYFGKEQPTMPPCSGNNDLEMKVAFPACWNGKDLYKNDNSHVAHPKSGFWQKDCPTTHPVKMSSIMYRIFWDMRVYGSNEGWFLSSDVNPDGSVKAAPGMSAHGDWFGAWNREAHQLWIDNCNNVGGADCELGILKTDQLGIPGQVNPDNDLALVRRKGAGYKGNDFEQPLTWGEIKAGLGDGKFIPSASLSELCPSKSWDGDVKSLGLCLTE